MKYKWYYFPAFEYELNGPTIFYLKLALYNIKINGEIHSNSVRF